MDQASPGHLLDPVSSRSSSVSSNGTPENKDKSLFTTASPKSTSYSRRVAEKKALAKQNELSISSSVNAINHVPCFDRIELPKVPVRQRPEQRPEQKEARRNKERERKHQVKESLDRLSQLLPDTYIGRRTKVS